MSESDPQLRYLHRAIRAVAVGAPLFWLFQAVLDMPNAAGGAVFAVISLGSFADFWGSSRRLAFRYLVTGAAGLVMLGLGALASRNTAAALGVTAAVSFAAMYLGVLGTPFYLARFPVIISYLLAVTSPGGTDAVAQRMLGWTAGGLLIAAASLLLWPSRNRFPVRDLAAATCRKTAATVTAHWGKGQRGPEGEVRSLLHELRAQSDQAHLNTAALAADERVLGATVHDIERLAAHVVVAPGCTVREAENRLATDIGSALEVYAEVLESPPGRPGSQDPGDESRRAVEALIESSAAYMRSLDEELAEASGTEAIVPVVDRQFAASNIRGTARLAIMLGETIGACEACATPPESESEPATEAGRNPIEALLGQFGLGSLWFREALRSAVALTIAVWLARAGLGDSHGFWVALGTFSVLRVNLSTTSRSVWSTLLGTAVGFGLSSGILLVAEHTHWILWVVMPASLFLASWTGRFRAEATAASFTTMLVVMYSIMSSAGFLTGEQRLRDVALGAGVTFVITLVIWPRVGRGPLRDLASIVDKARDHLEAAVERWERGDPPPPIQELAQLQVTSQLDDVLDALSGSAPATLPSEPRTLLVATVEEVNAVSVVFDDHPAFLGMPIDIGSAPPKDPDALDALGSDLARVSATLGALSQRLRGGEGDGSSRRPPEALRDLVVRRLSRKGAAPTNKTDAMLRLAFGFHLIHDFAERTGPARLGG